MFFLQDRDFDTILEKIERNKGIDFSLYRPGTLRRRISARLRATDCHSMSDYVVYLNREPEEYNKLIEEITINVTEFFRNPETFEAIRKNVIPAIIRDKESAGKRVIRAWSAGTSFGEEAYSLAILLMEALGPMIADFDVSVLGTDIDKACLERALKGEYAAASLKEVSRPRLRKYFDQIDNNYIVKDAVKKIVRFEAHNLVSDEFIHRIDLLLCRNVVIYFTRPLQEMVYSGFARALNKGGFMVLGKVESLWGYPKDNFEVLDNRERVYRKI